jgi:hypothetical protein
LKGRIIHKCISVIWMQNQMSYYKQNIYYSHMNITLETLILKVFTMSIHTYEWKFIDYWSFSKHLHTAALSWINPFEHINKFLEMLKAWNYNVNDLELYGIALNSKEQSSELNFQNQYLWLFMKSLKLCFIDTD